MNRRKFVTTVVAFLAAATATAASFVRTPKDKLYEVIVFKHQIPMVCERIQKEIGERGWANAGNTTKGDRVIISLYPGGYGEGPRQRVH